MELFENPIFSVEVVKKMFEEVDHEIKNLRWIPKPKDKNEKKDDKVNLDDLKNFDFNNPNFTDE